MSDLRASIESLGRNAVEILPQGELVERLRDDRPLRVKLGIDPTAPDIHLGHTVVLRKLREFQDAGHLVVLIIGDFTARVGDPSGRSAQRPMLEPAEIDANAATFQEQAFKVLDRAKTEVRFNSEWLRMEPEALFGLMAQTTVARLLEREDFSRRMAEQAPISALELLYPLLQGYDSVAIEADIELGGTDQKFNLLFGRDMQAAYGRPQQLIMTMPILPGTDGVRRMSKSSGNYIGVAESPEEMFGKVMSLPDAVMPEFFELVLGSEPPGWLPDEPARGKRLLGHQIVARFHDEAAADAAEQRFDRVFVRHELPDQIDEATVDLSGESIHLPAVLAEAFGVSRGEVRRLLGQGGVKVDGERLAAEPLDLPTEAIAGRVISLGKRRHLRLVGGA